MDYQIKLQTFEGPFDLLLHLIDKSEIDIYDIPIAEITKQYLEYIEAMEALDLDVASEFLVMAATLLSIKARMLLPKPPPELLEGEEDYDPRAKLVQDLLEYKKIKEAAVFLEGYYHNRQKQHERQNDESMYRYFFQDVNPLEGKTLQDLTSAFHDVWQRVKEEQTVHSIQREAVSIGGMMEKIVNLVAANSKGVIFAEVFQDMASKLHLVVGFLALLELMKLSVIRVQQQGAYSQIYVFPGDLSLYVPEA